jgi:RNase P/RNase MRP subunit p30
MYINTSIECGNNEEFDYSKKFEVYKFVGFTTLFVNIDYKIGENYDSVLKTIQSHSNLPLFGKFIISPRSITELKSNLKKLSHNKQFLISVSSSDKDLLTYAIKDSRVDLISFPNIMELSSITSGIISLLKTHEKFVEFSLTEVFGASSHERSRLFHEIAKFFSTISNNKHLLLYGGKEQSVFLIRGPYEISKILSTIFDLPERLSKSIVQSNPTRLLNKLKERSNSPYFSQGIKIIDEKKEGQS